MGAKRSYEYVITGGEDYETVAVSQTNQVLGGTGSRGDLLARLLVNVTTAATGTVSIKDGANTAVVIVPANTPIGPYVLELGIRSVVGAWQITTGAGASVVAVGQFSA